MVCAGIVHADGGATITAHVLRTLTAVGIKDAATNPRTAPLRFRFAERGDTMEVDAGQLDAVHGNRDWLTFTMANGDVVEIDRQ